jgi:hypothetical protein
MKKKNLFQELNLLWEPVQPYLAREVEELYGRRDGHLLEIGPFSGLIFALAERRVGRSFLIAAFPGEAFRQSQQQAKSLGLKEEVKIIESGPSLAGVEDRSADLAIFRGALFFPSFFQVDFKAIDRALTPGGIAFVGGGFGKYTPEEVIYKIGRRSEQLNVALGKVRVTVESVAERIQSANLEAAFQITTEGGLWVILRK